MPEAGEQFEVLSRSPEVRFRLREGGAPSALYLSPDDMVLAYVWNSFADPEVVITGRILLPNGQIVPLMERFRPTSNRALNVFTVQLTEGYLLSMLTAVGNFATRRGATFVRAGIARGGIGYQRVMQGYVTPYDNLFWPAGPSGSSVEGHGLIRSITGTDPAAGAEISETVPTGALWRPLSVAANLSTDATAANRQAVWTLDDGVNVYYEQHDGANQLASTTRRHVLSPQGALRGTDGAAAIHATVPDILMLAGHRIRTLTAALAAGDNWGAPQLLVEEWLSA